ncbi:MAG: DNA primase [marine bacterium B5-7]|nr:MAG: DNA primase [marine bacterium B5-7]
MRVDIVELIDARVPLKKAGTNFMACCPFHAEKSPSFTVSQTKQFYHCFGCGVHDNAIGFLMNFENLSFVESVEILAKQAGLQIPKEMQQSDQHTEDFDIMEQAVVFYRQQLRDHAAAKSAQNYLLNRGLSKEIIKKFQLGFAPPGWDNLSKKLNTDTKKQASGVKLGLTITKENRTYDRFRNRVMFPIHDRRGRPIGFGGRVIDPEDTPKYLNSPETPLFHKGREIYGFYYARQAMREQQQVIMVEGYMDVLALAQHGIEHTVATLGTAATADHFQQLFRVAPTIIFCFDGDRAGRQAAQRALQIGLPLIRDGLDMQFCFLPQGEDPDSLVRAGGKEGFLGHIQKALSFVDYFLQQFEDEIDITTAAGRARLLDTSKSQVQRMESSALRVLLIERLAAVVRMKVDACERVLFDQAPAATRTQKRQTVTEKTTIDFSSPVRLAIALVLQRPELAGLLTEKAFLQSLELPGLDILQDLLDLAIGRSEISSAALLTHWQEHKAYAHLVKLATWEIPIPSSGWAAEFQGVIMRLHAAYRSQQIERLMAKANQRGLSDEERAQLAALIREKDQETTS